MADDSDDDLVHRDGQAHCPVDDCDWWVPDGMEYLYDNHRQTHQ